MSKPIENRIESFEEMNECLNEYYESMGNNTFKKDDKRGKFLAFCDDNSFDFESFKIDLFEDDPEDCLYLEFDHTNFPLKHDTHSNNLSQFQSQKQIQKTLQFCYNHRYPPTRNASNNSNDNDNDNKDNDDECEQLPIKGGIEQYILNITPNQIKKTKRIYKEQVFPMLCDDLKTDEDCLLKWLTIGHVNHDYSLLLHLVDAYNRDQIDFYNQNPQNRNTKMYAEYGTLQWIQSNASLMHLKQSQKESLQGAMNKYMLRVRPPMMHHRMHHRIRDSLKDISLYIAIVSQFVQWVLKDKQFAFNAVAPFQVDFMIAVKGVRTIKNKMQEQDLVDDDEETDSDADSKRNEEHQHNTIPIGNVQKKLKESNCIHSESAVDAQYFEAIQYMFSKHPSEYDHNELRAKFQFDIKRTKFGGSYKQFRALLVSKKSESVFGQTYPRKKRLCVLIDRRNSQKNFKDTITWIEPPGDCNAMPTTQHVPEWCFAASRKCLIPNKYYMDEQTKSNEQKQKEHEILNALSGADKKAPGKGDSKENAVINALSSCPGLMTLSFHIEQKDEIKCYLFWNGNCLRFYPQDIIDVFPYFFDEEYEDNAKFAKSLEAKEIAKTIKIEDIRFEKFYKGLHMDHRRKSRRNSKSEQH